jgi:hypothetical protein
MMVERTLNRAFDELNRACASHVPAINRYVPTIPTNAIKHLVVGK